MRLVPVIAKGRFDHFAPCGMDVGVGHNRHLALAQLAAAIGYQFGQQPGLDPHLVGTAGHVDGDHSHASMPSRIFSSVSICGPLALSTWIGAWL